LARKTVAQRQAVLAVLLLVSVAMLTWYFREPVSGFLHSTQRGGLRVISPLESATSHIIDPFKGAYQWVGSLFSARSENERLRAEVDQLRTEVISLREAAAENARLKEMLGFTNQPSFPQDYQVVVARVIGRGRCCWY
jgi:cell shape-determining protein MreC